MKYGKVLMLGIIVALGIFALCQASYAMGLAINATGKPPTETTTGETAYTEAIDTAEKDVKKEENTPKGPPDVLAGGRSLDMRLADFKKGASDIAVLEFAALNERGLLADDVAALNEAAKQNNETEDAVKTINKNIDKAITAINPQGSLHRVTEDAQSQIITLPASELLKADMQKLSEFLKSDLEGKTVIIVSDKEQDLKSLQVNFSKANNGEKLEELAWLRLLRGEDFTALVEIFNANKADYINCTLDKISTKNQKLANAIGRGV